MGLKDIEYPAVIRGIIRVWLHDSTSLSKENKSYITNKQSVLFNGDVRSLRNIMTGALL